MHLIHVVYEAFAYSSTVKWSCVRLSSVWMNALICWFWFSAIFNLGPSFLGPPVSLHSLTVHWTKPFDGQWKGCKCWEAVEVFILILGSLVGVPHVVHDICNCEGKNNPVLLLFSRFQTVKHSAFHLFWINTIIVSLFCHYYTVWQILTMTIKRQPT